MKILRILTRPAPTSFAGKWVIAAALSLAGASAPAAVGARTTADDPPELQPIDREVISAVAALGLRQRLALSASMREVWPRWRIELEPLAAPPGRSDDGVILLEATVDDRPIFTPQAFMAAGWDGVPQPGSGFQGHPGTLGGVAMGRRLRLDLLKSPRSGKVRITIDDASQVVDLHATEGGRYGIVFTPDHPAGPAAKIFPFFPGLYAETRLDRSASGNQADIAYRLAPSSASPERATVLRIYWETAPDQWRLLDAVTYLGPRGVPIRLPEFRDRNPDTVTEYERVSQHGDPRSYEHWLTDYLSEVPGQTNRPGIVQEGLPPPGTPPEQPGTLVHRQIQLPAVSSGRLQVSVVPAGWSGAGAEYLGLPFAAGLLAQPRPNGPVKVAIDLTGLKEPAHLPYGLLRLRLRFPANRIGRSEPILATGREGAGDLLYVVYADASHIRIGFDHWSAGGPITKPIEIDYRRAHDLTLSLGSLFPPAGDAVFFGVPMESVMALKGTLRVDLDGRTALETSADCYEASPSEVAVASNAIHGSTADPAFTGDIASVERIWPE